MNTINRPKCLSRKSHIVPEQSIVVVTYTPAAKNHVDLY